MLNGHGMGKWHLSHSGFGQSGFGQSEQEPGPGLLCSRWLWLGGAFSFATWVFVASLLKHVL
jgi:hypothetical protein